MAVGCNHQYVHCHQYHNRIVSNTMERRYMLYDIDALQVMLHVNQLLVMFQFLFSEHFLHCRLLLAPFLSETRTCNKF